MGEKREYRKVENAFLKDDDCLNDRLGSVIRRVERAGKCQC